MTVQLPTDIENSIIAKVHSGLFPSIDAAMTEAARLLLERIERNPALPAGASPGPESAAPDAKPIWERILERTAGIPDEEWDKVPTDLAEQHDHYLYGTPKRPTA
jgi:Arc/MetJ-type ribon-helix-helix transcriptional regulator